MGDWVQGRATERLRITFTNFSGRAALTNFPVLVRLSTSITDFSYDGMLSTNGYDLRFHTPDGTNLNYEIELFDTNATSYVWVQVPELTNDTRILMMWGSDASQLPCTTNGTVWSSNDYAAVYHMAETTGDRVDSSPEGNDASPSGTPGSTASGQVGRALDLDADLDYLDSGATTGLPSGDEPRSTFFWHKSTDNVSGSAVSFGRASVMRARWSVQVDTDQKHFIRGGNGFDDGAVHGGFLDNTWGLIGATYDGTTVRYYRNGVSVGAWNATLLSTDSDRPVRIGRNAFGDVSPEYRQGFYDEVRISTVQRSIDWIWACWMNQSTDDHDDFVEYKVVSGDATVLMIR